MNRFDYRLIRQFLLFSVVAEEGSIHRAAERLYLSATPLTNQLNELEGRLGMKLLERSPRGVTLTPVGQAFLPKIQGLVAHAEMIDYSLREMRRTHRTTLQVGAVNEAMLTVVPGLIRRMRAVRPDVSVFTKEIDSAQAKPALLRGEIAVAFGWFGNLGEPVATRVVRRERFVCIVPEDDAIAHTGAVRLSDLTGRDWLLTGEERNPDYADRMRTLLAASGVAPRMTQSVDSIGRQVAFVACGQGIALVPESAAARLPPTVKSLRLVGTDAETAIAAAWNPGVADSARDDFLAGIAPE